MTLQFFKLTRQNNISLIAKFAEAIAELVIPEQNFYWNLPVLGIHDAKVRLRQHEFNHLVLVANIVDEVVWKRFKVRESKALAES